MDSDGADNSVDHDNNSTGSSIFNLFCILAPKPHLHAHSDDDNGDDDSDDDNSVDHDNNSTGSSTFSLSCILTHRSAKPSSACT